MTNIDYSEFCKSIDGICQGIITKTRAGEGTGSIFSLTILNKEKITYNIMVYCSWKMLFNGIVICTWKDKEGHISNSLEDIVGSTIKSFYLNASGDISLYLSQGVDLIIFSDCYSNYDAETESDYFIESSSHVFTCIRNSFFIEKI